MPYYVSGDDPLEMHERMAYVLDVIVDNIKKIIGKDKFNQAALNSNIRIGTTKTVKNIKERKLYIIMTKQ